MAAFPIDESAFDDPRLRAVVNYLEQHISNPERLSLQQAARIANLSPEYFCRLFRLRVGVGFMDWQCAFRMEHAKRLLVDRRTRTCATVGLAVGYENSSTFGKVFKSRYGMTPGQLRKLATRSSSARVDVLLRPCEGTAERQPMSPLVTALAQRFDDFQALKCESCGALQKSKAVDQ
jgi:AraC-like DNA-binding protein